MLSGLNLEIEGLKIKTGLDYLEIISELCQTKGIDVYDIAGELHSNIKSKMYAECRKKNMMKEKQNNSLVSFFK